MRDRAEWQVAHNSTDKNKATPLILVIFLQKTLSICYLQMFDV